MEENNSKEIILTQEGYDKKKRSSGKTKGSYIIW